MLQLYIQLTKTNEKEQIVEVTLKVRHGYFIRQLDKSESGIVPGSF